jgi:hypothetical protein
MKDIDQLLQQKAHKPNRELSQNFTIKTITEIKSRPTPQGWLTDIRVKILRHAWLSLAGLVLIGGTAAAAVALWPTPKVTPLITKQLPSGNHIVGYNAANCDYFSGLDGHNAPPSSDNVYYELRQGANISDQQLKDSLQAICEENLANNAISRIENQLPKKGNSTMTYRIDAISSQSLMLSLDPHYDKANVDLVSPQTYSRFSPDLIVYNENSKTSLSDLRSGDSVKLIYNDTSGQVQTPQNYYVDLNHPENIVITAILKVPPLTADPNMFFTHLGRDFVGLETCQSSPTGFCRTYEFAK